MKKLTLENFVEFVLILTITMVLVLIGNCINTVTDKNPDTFVSVLDGLPGLLILFGIALAGLCVSRYTPKIPSIIWITLFGVLLAMPYNTLTGPFVAEQVNKIGLLPAATPVLAYAGVSIGKDWVEFKKIGWKGILISVLVMIGTYLGSALIAQAILTAQGII
ncbi:MAG: hypothetical protein Q4C82_02955 [Eubacteriales bacterium]|nr:hypothetical protein [Eubacteriales bacterium]